MPAERKYALIKIKAGDWILPSNDGQRFYRLNTYTDGPCLGLDIPRDRTFWQVHRLTDDPHGMSLHDMAEWFSLEDPCRQQWEHVAGLCRSRADAIADALSYDESEYGRAPFTF